MKSEYPIHYIIGGGADAGGSFTIIYELPDNQAEIFTLTKTHFKQGKVKFTNDESKLIMIKNEKGQTQEWYVYIKRKELIKN